MSAYNKMNGEYCGQHRHLLTEILRGEWDFGGFVHSDWVMGVYQQYGAAAGLDVENPEPVVFGEKLTAAVEAGYIEPQVIDTACRRILHVAYRFVCAEDPLEEYPINLVACEAHAALALEAAEKSAVLLENDGVLPLSRERIGKLAVLGKVAGIENTGDFGSSRVRPPYVVTPLEGFVRALGEEAVLTGDEDDLEAATMAACAADAVVVIVGYTADDEGEYIPGDINLGQGSTGSEAVAAQNEIGGGRPSRGGDRSSLELKPAQVALIEAASASGKPVIVVIVAGSAVLVEGWREKASAIVQTFYSGMEGGTALAKLLLGEIAPSGRLPFTVARDSADYPFFDKDADAIEYGYWHGYAKFEHEGLTARYPFGHGLSYTTFSYRALTVRRSGDAIEATVAVRNDGDMAADEVIQLYVGYPGTVSPRAPKNLKAFARVSLAPGETKVSRLTVPLASLRYRDPVLHGWSLESGEHTILIARSAADPEPLSATILL